MPYEAHKSMEAIVHGYANQANNGSGITPMLEKASFPSSAESSKKRSASPEQEIYKRSKSVSEDTKTKETKLFDDQSWD